MKARYVVWIAHLLVLQVGLSVDGCRNAVAEDLVHNRRVAVNPQTQRPASSRLIHASRDREFEPSPLPEGGSEL
jgi:hypothetical protein